ncbi:hypothetical protein QFZ20_000422 [Flavobacterium sp. W4I14]|nr:hypothetical protein [Flavobacterium sp. W4I14]
MQIAKNIIYPLLALLILLFIYNYGRIISTIISEDDGTKNIRNNLIGTWILVKKQGFTDNAIKPEDLREVTYLKYFVCGPDDLIPDPYLIKTYNSAAGKWLRNRVFFIDSSKEAQKTSEIIRLTKDSLIIGDRDVPIRKNNNAIPMRYLFLRKNK